MDTVRDDEEENDGRLDDSQKRSEVELQDKETSTVRAAGVVLGVLMVNIITTGYANSYGIMLRSLESAPSSPFRNPSHFNMGFVTGLAVGLIFVLGPAGNILTRKYGVRATIGLGVFLMTFALMMASLAFEFYQLLLSLGVLYGLGASFAFVPAMSLPSQFFPTKRGLATGVAASGSPLGAMILSPIIQSVIDSTSVQWSMRVLGFIALLFGSCATVLCRSRPSLQTEYKFMDMTIFQARGYALYMLFAFLQMFGYIVPVLTLANYARALGLSDQQGSSIVIILNAGNFAGRLLAGLLGDRMGVLNTLTLFTFFSGLMCLICWIFARSFAILSVFACLWGIGAGGYWSLTVPCSAKLVGMHRLGSAVAVNYLMNVIPPIFASSIGTKIEQATSNALGVPLNDPRAYRYLIIWSGLSYIVPAFILLIVRLILERKLWRRA